MLVEYVYLSNLSLKLRRTYSDGDIPVDKIKTSLLSSDLAVETLLCDNDYRDSLTKDGILQTMEYTMERYVNTRWTFFIPHLKCNGNGNLVNKRSESQASWTEVASDVVCTKAMIDTKEKEIWKDTGKLYLTMLTKNMVYLGKMMWIMHNMILIRYAKKLIGIVYSHKIDISCVFHENDYPL